MAASTGAIRKEQGTCGNSRMKRLLAGPSLLPPGCPTGGDKSDSRRYDKQNMPQAVVERGIERENEKHRKKMNGEEHGDRGQIFPQAAPDK